MLSTWVAHHFASSTRRTQAATTSTMKLAAILIMATAAMLLCGSDAASSTSKEQYCKLCDRHTMCIYEETGSSRTCLAYTQQSVGVADQQRIVEAHNNIRSNVALGLETRGVAGPQPGATNMRELVWDEELAMIAQRFVDQCLQYPTNDACRMVKKYDVGQNVYRDYSQEPTANTRRMWPWAINKWLENVAYFDSANIAPFVPPSDYYSQYTQLVWADTDAVGCGHAYYKVTEPNYWYHDVYICNYGTKGNNAGTVMYEVGDACSNCPKATKCSSQYPGLCKANKNN